MDGSPDNSMGILEERLPAWPVRSTLVELSRNFGSFSAIMAGLQQGAGELFRSSGGRSPRAARTGFIYGLMVRGEVSVVYGHRTRRADPWWSQFLSECFWGLYRQFAVKDMPKGGVDVFGCTRQVRDRLIELREANTNLIALLLWLGFRRGFVPYERRARMEGRSAWTFGKKFRYAFDSLFNFTDLPIRLLLILGAIGTLGSVFASAVVFGGWALGYVKVLGYTPLMLLVSGFGGLTALGLGVIGQYLWLSLQNVRNRPNFVVKSTEAFVHGETADAEGKGYENALPDQGFGISCAPCRGKPYLIA